MSVTRICSSSKAMSSDICSSKDYPWNDNLFPSYVSQTNYNDTLYPKGDFRDGSTMLTTYLYFCPIYLYAFVSYDLPA